VAAAFSPVDALADLGPGPRRRGLARLRRRGRGGGDLGARGGLGAPVDALGVGPARRDRGAAFVDLKPPDFAFLHGDVPVSATVEASDLAGKTVT